MADSTMAPGLLANEASGNNRSGLVEVRAPKLLTDPKIAIDFLRLLDPTGWHNVVAIDPNSRRIVGITRPAAKLDEIADFIARHIGRWNLYYSVNAPRADAPNRKLRRKHIDYLRAVFVDIDPPKGMPFAEGRCVVSEVTADLLFWIEKSPTFSIDSGGGHQHLWRLSENISATADSIAAAEAQSLGIAERYRGDTSVFDVAHVLRLPGTNNFPDAGKREHGRIVAPTGSLAADRERVVYDLAGLAELAEPAAPAEKTTKADAPLPHVDMGRVRSVGSLEDLPDKLRKRFDDACARWPRLQDRWGGGTEGLNDTSRSGVSFDFTGMLKQGDAVADATEAGMLLALVTNGYGAEISEREIQRCWANSWGQTPEEVFEAVEPEPDAAAGEERAPLDAKSSGKPPLPFRMVRDIELGVWAPPLVKGLLDQGQVSALIGPSNTGKSFLAIELSYAVATGGEFLGRKAQFGGVLYIAAEGGRNIDKRFVARNKKTAGGRFPLALISQAIDLSREGENDVNRVIEAARRVEAETNEKLKLIVIDTLSQVMAGSDENSSKDMTRVGRNLQRIRDATGAHVMVVHHVGKDETRGARGHSALGGLIDTVLEVKRSGELVDPKQRDEKRDQKLPFNLEIVDVGRDVDGDRVTSCIVVPAVRAFDPPPLKPDSAPATALAILRDAVEREGLLAEGRIPSADGVFAGKVLTLARWKQLAIESGKLAEGELSAHRRAFDRAFKLLSQGHIQADGDFVWISTD